MAYHDEPPLDLPCTFSTYLAAGDRYVSTKDFQKALLEYDKGINLMSSFLKINVFSITRQTER